MVANEQHEQDFPFLFAAAVIGGLLICSTYSYLLFHIMVEICSVSIGFTLFILTWNARRFLPDICFKILGVGYAFIAFIDLLHTIAYKGMNVFAGYGPNLPTQLWITARYLQAFTLCAAPLLLGRRLKESWLISGYLATVTAIVVAVFSGHFPACFVEGKGLTLFKIASEYVIAMILLCSLVLFHRIRDQFSKGVYSLLVASIICTALSEIAFTAYLSVYSPVNMAGHIFKLAAFYLLYRALLVTGFREPLDLIFRDLQQTQESLRRAHDTLEDRVRERTAQLRASEEEIRMQAMELEQEVAERQMAQESLEEQTMQLEEEVEARRKAQAEVERLNSKLEERVKERTSELVTRNMELQKAYEDLKKIQAQLLQQDKMASIGQLAAGVAHEINNPMGFILSNLSSLGKYAEKVATYLDVNERALAGCDPAARLMVETERHKLKMDYIQKDMPELIGESLDGAQRVKRIVQDLKQFSRSDSTEGDFADINEGLDSTLSIAWNELKYKTNVVKDYGELPRVWCNMGQLNQVFLNMLVNAAHAIKERGEIGIRTWEQDGTVRIAISDTGSGIAPEHLSRVFEPFFTTKEVGRGTGLGLAIAYDIVVNKHGGTIEVVSELGKGTTFTIVLPVKKDRQSKSSDTAIAGAA